MSSRGPVIKNRVGVPKVLGSNPEVVEVCALKVESFKNSKPRNEFATRYYCLYNILLVITRYSYVFIIK